MADTAGHDAKTTEEHGLSDSASVAAAAVGNHGGGPFMADFEDDGDSECPLGGHHQESKGSLLSESEADWFVSRCRCRCRGLCSFFLWFRRAAVRCGAVRVTSLICVLPVRSTCVRVAKAMCEFGRCARKGGTGDCLLACVAWFCIYMCGVFIRIVL